MADRRARNFLIPILMLIALSVFAPGIDWGLPTRAVDPFLFGDTPVWSGEQIADLAPADSGERGADVDANPIAARDTPIVLNETDAQRAEIIRRYRLFSYQPDEMITFKALAQIRTHQGDPRLYQYGGLWIYPVGAMLGIADVLGFVDLRGGREGQIYYLDHPEAFGRFYVVARSYTLLWGLVGVWGVFWIVRRMTGSDAAASAGALAYIFMPVVVNMAHEAKPHLPGAVLMLLAIIAAAKFVETGKRRWCLATGALCGAAFGMVISALFVFAIIPVMVTLRSIRWRSRLRDAVIAGIAGILVHAITNPYVWINVLTNRALLRSNLSNSTAMYGVSGAGVSNAMLLLLEGMSPVLAASALFGLFQLTVRLLAPRRLGLVPARAQSVILWLVAAPAVLVAIQYSALASGKPSEYARFALYLDIALVLVAGAAFYPSTARRPRLNAVAALVVLGLTAAHGLTYTVGFVNDARPQTSRLRAARELDVTASGESIGVPSEPAPYSLPPVNLFDRRLILLPKTKQAPERSHPLIVLVPVELHHEGEEAMVLPSDTPHHKVLWPFKTPISWADKQFLSEKP